MNSNNPAWNDMDCLFKDDEPYPEGSDRPTEIDFGPAMEYVKVKCDKEYWENENYKADIKFLLYILLDDLTPRCLDDEPMMSWKMACYKNCTESARERIERFINEHDIDLSMYTGHCKSEQTNDFEGNPLTLV